MKRRWNWPIWAGFVVVVAGLFSYGFFARFPITRDFPWANLLLFGIGIAMLLVGLFRAFGKRRLIFSCWIKMENLSGSAIYFPTQKVLR